MKKFSFKKLITVSLFFTSVIFTSAFTTCFIPTISTSHSSDQPNATKIDLNDYNNKTLPESIYKPDDPDMIEEILIGQLEWVERIRPVGWEDWECYPNQFNLVVESSTDTGGSFTLTAKPNAINYVGSSTATISFNYTDSSKTDISTIITNIQLTTDTNAFSVTPSSQQLLTQLKQVNQNARINSLTVDPSTAVWDKTHVIVGDETHSGSYKVTVSVKPNDPIYTGTVDVYYLVHRDTLSFNSEITLPKYFDSNEDKYFFYKINDIDSDKMDLGNVEWSHTTDNPSRNATFESFANPYYLDVDATIDLIHLVYTDTQVYFTLSYDQLIHIDGWSGFTEGAIRFYKVDAYHHYVLMLDEYFATCTTRPDHISIGGTDVVFGDYAIDPDGISWTIIGPYDKPNLQDCGAFGGLPNSSMAYSSFYGSVTLNKSLIATGWTTFRTQRYMTTCIFPSDSDIEFLGPGTFYCSGVIEQIFPASLKEIHVTNQFWYDGQYVAGSSLQSFTIKANFFYPCFIRSGWKMPYYWDGTGRGRMYVKNEALRQQYISDATWSLLFNPGSATLSDMILVDPTN